MSPMGVPPSGKPIKAAIVNMDTGETVVCNYNPTEFEVRKTVSWSTEPRRGHNVPQVEFTSGNAEELTLRLFFDTFEIKQDVRMVFTKRLWDMALVDESRRARWSGRGRPPHVKFIWGRIWSFTAVITSISQRFTMFMEDGTPVRAEVNLSLKQVADEAEFPWQNPTSGGNPGYRHHRLQAGERLDTVAAEAYGDPNHWRFVAEVNDIDDPLQLVPGTVLTLPPLP